MNVQPIPGVSDRIDQIRLLTAQIVNKEILPHENELWVARSDDAPASTKRRAKELRDGIKERVKQAGLWAPRLSSVSSRRTPATRRSSRSTGRPSRSRSG